MPSASAGDRSIVLPSEIVSDRVVPTIRSMLARELADHGLTQTEIANHLGVTQAAVSTYIAQDGTVEDRIHDDARTVETVERVADGLAAGEMDAYQALGAIMDLIHQLEDRGPICELHEEAMPSLRGTGCDLCVRGFDTDLSRERSVLTGVRRAARRLANTPELAEHIPNVGTNVGMALPDATEVVDVAAIPGRIYEIRGRIEVPSNPEFGASQHVATAIIAAMQSDPRIRGAMNLATSDNLLDVAAGKGVEAVEIDPAYENRLERLESVFATEGDVPEIVYHRGEFGIEPILYVFGESALDAVEAARALVDAA